LWLATVCPISGTGRYFSLSLALDAYHAFSNETLGAFSNVADSLLSRCSEADIEQMKKEEKKKGNPGHLSVSKRGLLRVILPASLAEQAKAEIVDALSALSMPLVIRSERD